MIVLGLSFFGLQGGDFRHQQIHHPLECVLDTDGGATANLPDAQLSRVCTDSLQCFELPFCDGNQERFCFWFLSVRYDYDWNVGLRLGTGRPESLWKLRIHTNAF